MGWLLVAVVFALVGVVSVTLELDRTRWARWQGRARDWWERGREAIDERSVPTGVEHAAAAVAALLTGFGLSRLGLAVVSDPARPVATSALLLGVAATVVGLPLLSWLLWRIVGRLPDRPTERASPAWTLHVTIVAMGALALATTATADLAGGLADPDLAATPHLVEAAVWAGVWLLYWALAHALEPSDPLGIHAWAGTVVGLLLGAFGAWRLLARGLAWLAEVVTAGEPVAVATASLLQPAVLVAIGLAAWALYWRRAREQRRSLLGDALVVVVGATGGLVLALAGTWVAVSDLLVWLLGDIARETAVAQLPRLPTAIAAALVGLGLWRFHAAVAPERFARRTELVRVRDYLLAGLGLAAATVGGAWLIAGGIEWVTGLALDQPLQQPASALLRAASLAVLGVLVWRRPWRRVQALVSGGHETSTTTTPTWQRGAAAPPAAVDRPATMPPLLSEQRSPVRRAYLTVVTVVWGTAAVAAFLLALLGGLEDLLDGRSGAATLHAIRWPLGVFLAAGIGAVGHGIVRAADPRVDRAAPRLFPSHVLLVGRISNGVVTDVARLTGADVVLWRRDDEHAAQWHPDAVASALYQCGHDDVMVIAGERGFEVVPVARE